MADTELRKVVQNSENGSKKWQVARHELIKRCEEEKRANEKMHGESVSSLEEGLINIAILPE